MRSQARMDITALRSRYGQIALPRYARWVLGHPERLETMKAFVARRGPLAVFVARFVPGVRFTAGPLAGALGMPFSAFLFANVAGAVLYVPVVVGAGLAVRGLLKQSPFAESLNQIKKDAELLDAFK